MGSLPQISVLIPAKNAASTIHIAIEDALMQTGVDLQVVIANDSSTDNTLEIVKDYQKDHENITVIQVTKPGGIVAGRNELLKTVKTEFIAWLDADDGWPRKDKLQRQIGFLQKNKEHALVGDGKVRGVFLENLKQKNFKYPLRNEDIQVRLLLKNSFIMSSLVARTAMIKEVLFEKEWEYLEDYVWVKTVAKNHKVANMVLGGTLHFISTPKQQEEKDNKYLVYQKEAELLSQEFTSLNIEIEASDASLLADFARRNRSLSAKQSDHLDQLIRRVARQLIQKGFGKAEVNGFFWDIQMRRLKCRWLKG